MPCVSSSVAAACADGNGSANPDYSPECALHYVRRLSVDASDRRLGYTFGRIEWHKSDQLEFCRASLGRRRCPNRGIDRILSAFRARERGRR